jgi:hypothetical protein
MLTSSSPASLYRIEECPDLISDACLTDETCQLIFLSLWGRDTAIQEFLARLTLGTEGEGLDHCHLIGERGERLPLFVGSAERLEKRTTRSLKRTLFGTLIHLWLFDARCVKPDKANATALAILAQDAPHRTERLWSLVKETCPLPLLDHWREPVLEVLTSRTMLSPLPVTVGPLEGYRLHLDVEALASGLGELIREGRLGLTGEERDSTPLLRRAA